MPVSCSNRRAPSAGICAARARRSCRHSRRPKTALGDDLARHLPEGENAQRWRGLLNEAQVILHKHPLNTERAQRGLPPVNSLWFWGAGMLPEWVRTTSTQVFSDDEIVVALARLAKVSYSALANFEQAMQSLDVNALGNIVACGEKRADEANASRLLDLSRQRDIAALERNWFAPIDNALVRRRSPRCSCVSPAASAIDDQARASLALLAPRETARVIGMKPRIERRAVPAADGAWPATAASGPATHLCRARHRV